MWIHLVYTNSQCNYLNILIGVGPISILNRDPSGLDSFIAAVQALQANGGGDFPEFALDGMLQGLQTTLEIDGVTTDLMIAGSQMIVLTDALSQRPEITDSVIAEANMRGVCIHFFIARVSGAIRALTDGIYERVAAETSGTLTPDYSNFQLASFIADTAVAPCGFINVPPTSSSSPVETFDLSTFTSLLQLSIGATDGAIITISRPDSSSATVVANQGFAVFSEGNPLAGTWSVSVSTGTVQISLIQRTIIDTTLLYVTGGSNGVPLLLPSQSCKSCMQWQKDYSSYCSHGYKIIPDRWEAQNIILLVIIVTIIILAALYTSALA